MKTSDSIFLLLAPIALTLLGAWFIVPFIREWPIEWIQQTIGYIYQAAFVIAFGIIILIVRKPPGYYHNHQE